jgi:putative radical SAM enzyme (TIGR03279 family)
MAPRFRRTLYIKDDDYRYSFLFGHYVTLTNLTEHDWWRIKNMRLSPLYISVHVTDLDKRRQFLRNKQAPDIIEQLVWLAEHNIKMHTQLVIVPEFNDGNWLAKSISDLAALWPAVRSISLVPVGLTKQHKYGMRTHSGQEAARIIDFAKKLQISFLDQFGLRFVYPTDEWYLVAGRDIPAKDDYDGQQLEENGLGMVRRFLDEWKSLRTEIATSRPPTDFAFNGNRLRSVTLVTGTLFGPTLSEVTNKFATQTGLRMNVVEIVNKHLGDTITVAGLLMGNDIVDCLLKNGYGDLVILPSVMFDHPDNISLDDISPQFLADALSRPVALADLMGDVWDAVTGNSSVIYYPK